MDFCIKIKERKNVTKESMSVFLNELINKGVIGNGAVKWVSYQHYDPSEGGRIGSSFHPNTSDEVIEIIKENGVDF